MSRLVILLVTLLLGFATYATGASTPVQPASIDACGPTGPDPDSVVEGTVLSGGIERHYRAHIPRNYQPDRASPLIVALHGRGSDAQDIANYSGLSTLDAVVVYPEALVGSTGETAWSGAPYSPDVDDVAFIDDLLNRMNHDLCVDTGKVYAVGMSNGGGLAAMLGCRLADRFAGYATVAGAFYPEAGKCQPSEPLPLINFHGTGDTVVPYEGDPDKGQPSVQAWLDKRATINGCGKRGPTESPEAGVEVERWRNCTAPVTHYRMVDGGHEWPTKVHTAEVIWKFLNGSRLK